MPKRHVDWNMGKKYGQGWLRGIAEQEADMSDEFHLSGMTYREFCGLLETNGRVTLRNGRYPMVNLILSLVKKESYYLHPIADKFIWGRFDTWRNGTAIKLIWEGYSAQSLIRKLLPYMLQESMRRKALKALMWIPKGGAKDITGGMTDLEELSVW